MYALVDSGNQQKWERFGQFTLVRPCSQALWQPQFSKEKWQTADASFSREGGNSWKKNTLPASWVIEWKGFRFKIAPTDFGHLGLFPEHADIWEWSVKQIMQATKPVRVLNLFAYSGGASIACAKAGAEVCHLDASKGMVSWAKENALVNGLQSSIRWIVDDVFAFLKREYKRGRKYEGLILDPPTFGRGNHREVFRIERDIRELLTLCHALLSEKALFIAFTTHTPGMTPVVMHHLLEQMMKKRGTIVSGEMMIPGERGLPSGSFAKWVH